MPSLLLLMAGLGLSAAVDPDLYMLATRWPQTLCETHDGGCTIPANVSFFTIHGLWPDNYSGDNPFYCQGDDLDMKQLQPILPSLLQLWPNFFDDSTSEDFLDEWDKHGKCAIASGDFPNQEAYFAEALKKATHYNGLQILAAAGIVPSSQPQDLNTILAAIDDALDSRFVLSCDHQQNPDRFLLSQLEVCFSPSMSPVDCYDDDDQTSYHVNGCSKHEDVYYLPIQH